MKAARGRIKASGMNRLEAAYGEHLMGRKAAGEILWYRYEGTTLKLADDCRYTPDFMVMLADGLIEMHETKGPHRWEDSIVKLRVAASLYPFAFRLVTRAADGCWEFKEF